MAYFFGDGFDLYSASTDAFNGYWEPGGSGTGALATIGRFPNSRSMQLTSFSSTAPCFMKTSGVNDALHHISCAVYYNSALSGTSAALWYSFNDLANVQCTVVFRSDGAIQLYSGTATATLLATYTGAVPLTATWYQFEIEVFISATAGYMNVRRNGNVVNDFATATNLNTRAGSTNNYANRLSVGGIGILNTDDLLWRSDTSALSWLGDIRCWTRMPISDSAVSWSRSGVASPLQQSVGGNANVAANNNFIKLQPYVCNYTGNITSITLVSWSLMTGNVKAAIWADNAGVPGAVLASCPSQPTVSGGAGNNVFTLATPLAVTSGQRIWVGGITDTGGGTWSVTTVTTNGAQATGAFSSFPQASPVVTTGQNSFTSAISYATTTGNYSLVSDAQQDAGVTYNYSTTVGQSDLYGIAPITSTPATVIAVTTRGYVQKSDAGVRNMAIQLQSGTANAQTPSTALNVGLWWWLWRTDLSDPATGSAWTPSAVNSLTIGAVITA